MAPRKSNRRSGLILLVVLSMLAFLGLLVISYVAFTSSARRTAGLIATAEFREPNTNDLFGEAIMRVLRGPASPQDRFYGQSMFDDYFGDRGSKQLQVARPDTIGLEQRRPLHVSGPFVRIPVENVADPYPRGSIDPLAPAEQLDDYFTGRTITFLDGPLENESFRVLRSIGARTSGTDEAESANSLFIQLDPNMFVTLGDGNRVQIDSLIGRGTSSHRVGALFYAPFGGWGADGRDDDGDNTTDEFDEAGYPPSPGNPNNDIGYRIHLNPTPLNAPGLGYRNTGGSANWNTTTVAGKEVPVAFLPNRQGVDKSSATLGGDYDESYDAADFNTPFLAGRVRYLDSSGVIREKIIPSYHRPSLINYLINLQDWTTASNADLRDVVEAIGQSTFRPFPRSDGSGTILYEGFSGGSSDYGIIEPVPVGGGPNPVSIPSIARLQLLVNALINGTNALANGQREWDVDCDGDGVADSVWIDIGLPLITSREGKLLRPMIAVLIEDTNGKLNVNTHGFYSQTHQWMQSPARDYTSSIVAPWAGTSAAGRNLFRGLGFGPADVSFNGIGLSRNQIESVFRSRYAWDAGPDDTFPVPGHRADGADALDQMLNLRPEFHNRDAGLGYSVDPMGHGAIGVGRSGRLYAAGSGTQMISTDNSAANPQAHVNESNNNPYQFDPTGLLTGDQPFTPAELEAIVRANSWDTDVLPQRLRNLLPLGTSPRLSRMLTTTSSSTDAPVAIGFEDANRSSSPLALVSLLADELNLGITATSTTADVVQANTRIRSLLAPELRLGRKIDINRPFGNSIDDNSNQTIDEPNEEASTATARPFPGGPAIYNASNPSSAANLKGRYDFGDTTGTPRELMARHLYVLMSMLKEQGYNFPVVNGTEGDTKVVSINDYDSHRLAQWAVNMVDYRDPDSIMTRFVYDPTPLDSDGWNITTNANSKTVWGCESPELVFFESAAFHDLRIKDTTLEIAGATGRLKGDPAAPDNARDEMGLADTDQVRIPQGSMFLEMYVNRQFPNTGVDNNSLAGWPAELYNLAGANVGLDLGRRAPTAADNDADHTNNTGAPVWRIAVSQPHYPGHPAEGGNPAILRQTHPNTYSFDHLDPFSGLSTQDNSTNLTIDRYIIFTPHADMAALNATAATMSDATTMVSGNQLFFAPNGNIRALPGEYVVLAPRDTTHLGSQRYADPDMDNSSPDTDPSTIPVPVGPSAQGFVFDVNKGIDRLTVTGASANLAVPNVVAPSRFVKIQTFRPDGWQATVFDDGMVGLNVSEPMPRRGGYYREPMNQLDSANGAMFPLTDAYVDYDDTAGTVALDRPEDLRRNNSPISTLSEIRKGNPDPVEPWLGTQREYCSVFLQRLANPLMPFNSTNNPYITVDWMPVDLTVFSGEESPEAVSPGNANQNYAQRSRERNGRDSLGRQTGALFTFNSQGPGVVGGILADNGTNYFQFDPTLTASGQTNFDATLGYLNHDRFGMTLYDAQTLGAAGAIVPAEQVGLPVRAFAVHDWLNRPFASHHELMMVPATSPGRLFQEFATTQGTAPVYYNPSTLANNPHHHLINFFNSTDSSSSNFARLFDFVHTLPRFRGEVDLIRPDQVPFSASGTSVEAKASRVFADLLQAPFSYVYDNRRQGTLNPNTIADYEVYRGMMYGHMTPGERGRSESQDIDGVDEEMSFEGFQASRRGYATEQFHELITRSSGMPQIQSNSSNAYNFDSDLLNGDFPTQFAHPFRTAADADLMPRFVDHTNATVDLRRSSAQGTLLRPDSDISANDQANPLFVRPNGTADHADRDRNAFMKYQTLMRMPNLVAPQSNVFSVQMTMGFFEVPASNLNALGKEYNAELSRNKRYKMMYMIDRSKPVAFIRGQNTNIRDSIIYERAVE